MAISRKPKTTEKKAKEPDINALINKGGSVAITETKKEEEKEKGVLLRIPSDTLEKINEVVASKKIRMPRHTWLLEAVYEKLEREANL